MDEFRLGSGDWRSRVGDEQVLLSCGLVAYEREIYLAVEKLTPLLQKTENRGPTEADIERFILIIRGP